MYRVADFMFLVENEINYFKILRTYNLNRIKHRFEKKYSVKVVFF